MKARSASFVRPSISFSSDVHRALEGIEKAKEKSLEWVVRDAAEPYLADKRPLSGKEV